jgi:hypothetical protein
MLHLHSAVRGTVPQKQRCDTADLNANWYHIKIAANAPEKQPALYSNLRLYSSSTLCS